MRIDIWDPSGCGLGLGLGLRHLGHRVVFAGPQFWWDNGADRLLRDLHAFAFEPARTGHDPGDSDLLIIVEVFADRRSVLGNDPPPAALAEYQARIRGWLDFAARARRVVILDVSDRRTGREPAFESIPGATLLARECDLQERGPWRAFPFLYNNLLLFAETMAKGGSWFVPLAERRPRWDWVFAGTVEHPRYGDRRLRALAHLQMQWPELTGQLVHRVPFVDVLRDLQAARVGVDLPGAGELCFRLHEYLALGIPIYRPEPFPVRIASGLGAVVRTDPVAAMAIGAEQVQDVYRRYYAPRAAAEWLLASIGTTELEVSPASASVRP